MIAQWIGLVKYVYGSFHACIYFWWSSSKPWWPIGIFIQWIMYSCTCLFLAGGPLHLGDIEELPGNSLCVRCPWHSWRFDLSTGQLKQPKKPGVCSVVYPVIVKEDGKLLIGFDQFDQKYFSAESSF